MYVNDTKVISNTFRDNLAGAVLMYSNDLIIKDNELSSNRRGAAGDGMLIKDDNNLWVEGNRILRNKFGMTVDGTPQQAGATAIFRRNLFALNDTGVGLLTNAPITFVENAMIDNTVQVKALSGELASALSSHDGAATAAAPGQPAATRSCRRARSGPAPDVATTGATTAASMRTEMASATSRTCRGRRSPAVSATRRCCGCSSSRQRSRPSTQRPICSPCIGTTR